jgi:glyoxylase-like metal-dependent hydrolase (beta-lactamase superfamily II)
MLIQIFPSGPFSTNAYVAACAKTREAAILDPAPDSFKQIETFLTNQKLNPKKILLTHSHWDHIADVSLIKEKYHIPVYIHALDTSNLQEPGSDALPCWIKITPVQPDILLEEGMEVSVGELRFQVLHTPGHSPGSVCFYEPLHHVLFSGDTLFQGTIGNLSFPTSQPSLMWHSLAKLVRLPPETRVFPGHGSETTIGAESSWLPYAKKLFDK